MIAEPAPDPIPPFSEEQQRTARAMAGLGVSRRQIAVYLRTDETTLKASLGDDLDQAEVEAISKVARALFTMATKQNNVAAAIFWMKARGGWQEKQQLEVTGKDDGPIAIAELTITTDDPVEASRQYQRLIRGTAL
ncbi:hypothetical protein [Neoroseomonas lacus]|uniref:Uncharacterized protein n=1 Tax=Neoroseomonas lacus TaxID=287609 RepID=A0A917L1J0_9PROT|nr:hypothetical protein [Neoroseomonas lacus]GGJ40479.1 hypothetical protein GCM10011320_55210 [Neoroseomonas lacus]